MPKLLIFTPCNQAIVGQDSSLSIIVVMNEVRVTIPRSFPDPIPDNAAMHLRWATVSHWDKLPDDGNGRFEQKVEMIDADGNVRPGVQVTTEFAMDAVKQKHTVVVNFPFMPALPDGTYGLRLSLRRIGDENWNVVTEYPIGISTQREGAEVLALR